MAFSVAGFPAYCVLATTVLVIILLRIIVLRRPAINLPPGPTGLPLLGSLHLLSALPHQNLAELAKEYGSLMSLRLGQAQCIVASSPETAMEFLKKQDANFCSRPPMRAGQVLMYGQDILFQNNSPIWRHLRKIFQVELTGTKRLEATRHVREEEVAHLICTTPRNREFELRTHLGVLFTNIISRLILNRRFSAQVGGHETEEQMLEIQTYGEIMEAIPKCLSAFYPGDFIPALKWLDLQGLENRFKETNDRMDSFVTKIISEHQAQRKMGPIAEREKDMVDILLDEVENVTEGSPRLQITMTNVKAILWDAFSAGTDTVLMSCEWIMSEVVCNPAVQSKAQSELDNVVGQHRRVQESDIPRLSYIQALVKEGLRLHPAAPVMAPHQSIHACKAFGYDIPAKTHLFVNVWAIGRDARVWVDPMEFNPGRWFVRSGNAAAAAAVDVTQGEFLPFGAGRRMCPGMALATVTLQHCIASLLQAFEWLVTEDPGMAEGPGLGVPRAVPLRVIAKPRLSSEFYS